MTFSRTMYFHNWANYLNGTEWDAIFAHIVCAIVQTERAIIVTVIVQFKSLALSFFSRKNRGNTSGATMKKTQKKNNKNRQL